MDQYLGEIRIFAGTYEPVDWKFCNGQLMKITDYQALYALLGTIYGGDGVSTFALPDLRGRLPVGCATTLAPGMTTAYPVGTKGGSETVTLTQATMPAHTHAFNATNADATTITPGPLVTFAKASAGNNYMLPPPSGSLTLVNLSAAAIATAGGNQPHENRMPAMALNYIISLTGVYPMAAN